MSTIDPLPPPPPPRSARKVPPPCWTHDETLALIEAYRDRYLALRRGYLRTADWDAVSSAVSRSFGNVSPAKSSAQCRHKIEKLRQRYRAEKQRSLSIAGKFISSWIFFKNLDFLDDGCLPVVGSNNNSKKSGNGKNGFVQKPSIGANQKPNSDLGQELDGGSDEEDEFLGDQVLLPVGFMEPNSHTKIGNFQSPNLDYNSNFVPVEVRPKKYAKIDGMGYGHEDVEGFDGATGFHNRSVADRDHSSVPSRFRSRKYSNMSGKSGPNSDIEQDMSNGSNPRVGFGRNLSSDWSSCPLGIRSKTSYGNVDGNANSNADFSSLNGYSTLSRLKLAKNGGVVKKETDPFAEVVSSIKFLGEGFLKMEKMKMDMAMELEKTRMEMEMKRSEMFLESQRQTVDAFMKVLMEKKRKAKMEASPET